MEFKFDCLRHEEGTWQNFLADWKAQCAAFEEDFSTYENGPISVVQDLAVGTASRSTGAYALHDGERYCAMCQVNVASSRI